MLYIPNAAAKSRHLFVYMLSLKTAKRKEAVQEKARYRGFFFKEGIGSRERGHGDWCTLRFVETHGGRFRIYKGEVQGNCFCGERQRIRALGKKQFFLSGW